MILPCIIRGMNDSNPEKDPRKQGGGKLPEGPSIWLQFLFLVSFLLVITYGYSGVKQYMATQAAKVPLSQIAEDVAGGKITAITIEGDTLKLTLP